MFSMSKKLSPNTERSLVHLGSNIRTARIKRRMTLVDMATRMGTSVPTLRRLEQGDGGVSIANLAMAMRALGELKRLEMLIDMGTDDAGLMMELDRLPQRVRRKGTRQQRNVSAGDGKPSSQPIARDEKDAFEGTAP